MAACAHGLLQTRRRWEAGCRAHSSCSWSSVVCQPQRDTIVKPREDLASRRSTGEKTYPRPNSANQANGIPSHEIVPGRTSLRTRAPRPQHRRAGRAARGEEVVVRVRGTATVERSGRGGGCVHRVRDMSGGARGPARRPELAQLFSELLARRRPVGANVIAQLLDVTLQVELVLLEPRDIELLPGGAALELAGNVLFVVAYDPVGEDAESATRRLRILVESILLACLLTW